MFYHLLERFIIIIKKIENVVICAWKYKVDNPAKGPLEVLMTIIVEAGGNTFQLSDDGNLTRKSSQASSRKEIQDWSSYRSVYPKNNLQVSE